MLLVLFGLAACQKNDDTLYLSSVNAGQLAYLDQWTGVYEGHLASCVFSSKLPWLYLLRYGSFL